MRTYLLCLALSLAGFIGLRADTKLSDGDSFRMSVSGAPKEFTQEYELDYTVDDGAISVPNVGRVKAVRNCWANFGPTACSSCLK